MNCRKISLYLEDYLNNDLDRTTASLVKDHLPKCHICQEKVKFIENYQRSIKGFEKLEAPSDFVVKFHQRLKDAEECKKTAQKPWFFPFLGKPALAGLVTIVLLILVFNPFRFINKPEQLNEAHLKPESAPENNKREKKAALNQAASQVETFMDKLPPKKVGVPVEDQTGAVNGTELNLVIKIAGQISAPTEKLSKSDFALKNAGIERSKAKEAEVVETPDLRSRIKAIIGTVNGQIISQEEKPGSETPEIITVMVPVSNYQTFLKELGALGKVTPTAQESLPNNSGSFLRIRLRFISE